MEEINQLRKQVKRMRILVMVMVMIVIVATLGVLDLSFNSPKILNASAAPVNPVIPIPGTGFKSFDPPSELDFCGEKVPLQEFEVRERYDFETLVTVYKNAATILGFKRANRWFPVIEPILKRNGIPDDFKYLAVIESNLANAISPSNAVGFWQFLDGTAKQYGLEVNGEIDERYHVEKSTEAACKYLNEAYRKFGSWTLAAASYNMGMGGLNREIESQKETDYYSLRLNSETSRYILRLVFTKELFLNPVKYGYDFKRDQLYPIIPVKEISVNTSVDDLVSFARENNTNYKLLRELNPWLRGTKLSNPQKKTYRIKLPAEGYDEYDKLLKISEKK